ncbi:MAG: ABC transporter permease [Planctomycetota bacterium]
MPPDHAALAIRNLSVQIAGKAILEHASLAIHAHELALLIGPSGAGKSILLQLISGVLGPNAPDLVVEGDIEIAGKSVFERAGRGRTGLVFQDHALFDDLSARDNLRFALAHRSHAVDHGTQRADELLQHFALDNRTPVRVLSGGQKQRLAIARTLAHDPEFLIYDEPTTGLDPQNTQSVVRWIKQTHEELRKTTLIVTHDHANVIELADRVILLDPTTRSLREIAKHTVAAAMRAPQPIAVTPLLAGVRTGLARRFFEGTASTLTAALSYLAHLLPRFPSLRWGAHFLGYYLKLLVYPSSLAYMATAGLILGFVATYFTFLHLPHRLYTEPLLIDEILAGLGYLSYRVLAPVLATLLIAARCGAAIASDIGNRVYARQVDALRSFAIEPGRYLLTCVALGFLVAMPVLAATLYVVNRYTSMLVFVATHPDQSPFFWDVNYHRLLRTGAGSTFVGTWWVLAKTEVCGAGIGAIAYFRALRPKRSGAEISAAVTTTIIWATLFVLATHFGFAFVEF